MLLCALTATAEPNKYSIALSLRYPAGDKAAPQPTGLYVDPRTSEVYIADGAGARIAIYDAQRRFSFEFSTRDRLPNPRQLAVDSEGRIFVLGDQREHTLAVFDYNGDFLNHLDLQFDSDAVEPLSLAITASDELMLLAAEPARVFVYSTAGEPLRTIELFAGDEKARMTPMLENLNVIGDMMIVTLPMMSQAAVCKLSGEVERFVGFAGGGPTELSFPMAATLAPEGGFVVLDKHRHLLQFLDSKGSFVREVGNFGMRLGCFFHPTTMAVCSDGVILVGQQFANRVQAVTLISDPVAEAGR
ncbi:MAG: NHL repeat-containing protein [bacterium]|nr:NHL repeat-containing protein [bacterium]